MAKEVIIRAKRIEVRDETVSQGRVMVFDFAGAGVSAAVSSDGETATITIAGGGAPTGPAGGELAGTYPDPTVASTHSGSAHHAQDTDIVTVTFFLETPVATDDQAFHRVPFAATLLQVDYLCVGGTNWVGQVQEADANGGTGVDTQTTDTTATAGTNAQVTSFSNSGLDAGDYLKLKSTSISGTPTSLVVTIQYRKA